jgi:hypothetical protein
MATRVSYKFLSKSIEAKSQKQHLDHGISAALESPPYCRQRHCPPAGLFESYLEIFEILVAALVQTAVQILGWSAGNRKIERTYCSVLS